MEKEEEEEEKKPELTDDANWCEEPVECMSGEESEGRVKFALNDCIAAVGADASFLAYVADGE